MLHFAQELLLLLFKEDAGDPTFVPEPALHHALAGALLMELAQQNRIDTDPNRLVVVDPSPVGDEILDAALARVAASDETRDAAHWVRELAADGDDIRAKALAGLVATGVLESDAEGALVPSPAVARARRYPAVDGSADGPEQEVRLRIMRVLFGDEIPSPWDVVIICLADACGMFERMLSKAELEQARERIDLVSRLDLIGQAVTGAVRTIAERAETPAPPPAKRIPRVKGLLRPLKGAGQDFLGLLADEHRKHGPVFELRLLHRRAIVLAGVEANRFANRQGRLYFTNAPWGGFVEGLGALRLVLNMDGHDHAAMRKAFASAFSRGRFQRSLDVADGVTRRQVAAWPRSEPLKPMLALQRIVAGQMGEILAGGAADDYVHDMAEFLNILLITRVARQLPMFLYARRYKRAWARLQTLAQATLASHEPGGPHANADDFVNDLIDLHKADPQFMPELDMRAWVLAPYLVGIETVASTCAFTLYAILKRPALAERIRAEADAFFDGPLTAPRLRELDVTHRTVLESLRVYPVAAVLFRMAANSFDFAGYHVPAGQSLYIPTALTHRLPECFPEPERFDIDRYLPERAEHRQPHAFAPFGVGTHRCLGGGFAEAQTLLTIATVMHAADIEMDPPDYELRMTNVPTPRPAKDFRFIVKGLRN